MTLTEVTQKLATAIGMELTGNLSDREEAAIVITVAAEIIRMQREAIALSAKIRPVVDMSPVLHEYN